MPEEHRLRLGTNRPTENLTIVNCQVTVGYEVGTLLDGTCTGTNRIANGRFKCGTESNGGFRNITLSNCTFRDCKGMALEEVDGGIMDNITINNVVMTDVRDYPIYITMGQSQPAGRKRRDGLNPQRIQISNVIATGVDRRSGIEIMGVPGHDIENVRLDNVSHRLQRRWYEQRRGACSQGTGQGLSGSGQAWDDALLRSFCAARARAWNWQTLTVGFDTNDLRPAMACTDVDGLEIDNFKGQTAAGVKPATFTDVNGLVVRNSPELQ